MRLLLDTHASLDWVYDPPRLGRNATRALADRGHEVFWSVASSWEVATIW